MCVLVAGGGWECVGVLCMCAGLIVVAVLVQKVLIGYAMQPVVVVRKVLIGWAVVVRRVLGGGGGSESAWWRGRWWFGRC